jgi:hypothetical protein
MKYSKLTFMFIFLFCLFSCERKPGIKKIQKTEISSPVLRIIQKKNGNDVIFIAKYTGPEFVKDQKGNFKDEAHMTSTKLTHRISKFLKSNYRKGVFYKLNFNDLKIKIKGNVLHKYKSSNQCEYQIVMPLELTSKVNSVTSIEHKGTWVKDYKRVNEEIAIAWKKRIELRLANGNTQMKLVETDKGFREYWIQFHSKDFK